MKELLQNNGWITSYECHCGGVHRIEFVKGEIPGAIIKVYPKRNKWRASRNSKRIGEGTSENIETFLNGLVA